MDSLSQLVLGASVGHVVLGNQIGRKALVLGAVLGTLPDLDVLVRYVDAVDSFTYHRSYSHSVFVLTLISVPMAMLLQFIHRRATAADSAIPQFRTWWLATFLCLVTHPLLDGFTIYGTQIFWPLNVAPVAIGSIFIIDPVYTLPLLIGAVWSVAPRRQYQTAATLMGLSLSSGYLALTLYAQQQVRNLTTQSLIADNVVVSPDSILVAPSPLSLMWRLVVIDEDTYLEGFYSVLDTSESITFHAYARGSDLLSLHPRIPAIARLDWFTGGFIAAEERGETVIIKDLRMGLEATYVFSFAVAEKSDNHYEPITAQLLRFNLDNDRVARLWDRLFDSSVDMSL